MFHCSLPLHDRSLTISRRLAALLPLLLALFAFAAPARAQSSPVPTDLRIGSGSNSLTLYWQPAANASGYNIYRGTSAGHESTTPIATGITSYNGNADYYTDGSAVNGTTYYYKVTAATFNGESGYSNEASGTPGVASLAAPNLIGSPGAGQAVLHWNGISGASHYDLYRSIGAGNGNYFAYVQNITGTSFTDTLLTNGTTYNYFVAAVDADGSGTGSNGVSVTPGEVTLPAPTNVHVYTQNGYLVVAWNTVPNASGYNIYRGTTAGGEANTPYSTSATSNYNNGYITYFNDTSVAAGTTYYYKVTAKNGVGESAKSAEADGLLNATDGASPILTAVGATSPSKITLTWNAISGATGYDVYKAIAGSGNYTIIAAQTGTTYADSAVTAGVAYSYFVSDYNGSFDEVGSSNTATATPGGALLPAPKGFVAQPYNSSIALTWTASAGATSYNLYRGTTAGGEGAVPIAAGITGGAYPFPNPSYIDSNVTAGTTYYYTLTASNNQGESPQTGEVSALAGAALLAAPRLSAILDSSNHAVLTWSAVSGATSYNIYRNVSGAGFIRRTNVTTTTYTDTNIGNTGTNAYYVCAVNAGGQGSASNTATVTYGQTAPPAPTGLTAGVYYYNNSEVTLTWNPVSGAASYNVYQGTSAGGEGAVPLLTGVTNPNNVIIGSLTSGTRYYFKVTAVNLAGESSPSNEATAKPNATVLAAPSLTASSPSTTEIDLKWTSISGTTGYSVYRSIGATGSYVLLTTATTNSYKDTGLTAGLIYAYYVVPVDADGSGSASNTVSVALGSAILPAPTGLYAFPNGTPTIRLVWNVVPGATSYNVYRGTTAGGEGSVPIATGSNNGYTGPDDRYFDDATAISGTVYYYKVTAVDAYGESNKSAEAAATSGGAALPAPTLTAGTSSTSITLTWSAVSGATSYTLRRTDPNGYYLVLTTTTSTSYTDSSALSGVTYSYYVFANSTLGGGSNSNTVTASVNQKTLAAPTGLAAYPNNGYISLYWNPVPGATSYNVYRSTSAGGEGSTPVQTGVGAPSYYSSDTVSGLTNSTKYYFEVTAVSAGGQSGKSNEASAIPGGAVLSAPTLSVSSTSGQTSLTWSSVSGATSYLVFRAIGGNIGYAVYIKSVTTTSTTDTGLTNGLSYTYTVIPVGANGDGSASNAVTVLVDGVVPPAPGGVAGYPEGTSYNQIIWSPVPGIASYNVYRGTTAGGESSTPLATNVGSVSGAVYYYNDSSVTAGTTYYYKITSVNSIGESSKSSEVSVITGGTTLGAPTLTASYSSSKVNLAWSAVSGAKSYNVYRNYAGQGFLRLTNVTGTTYSDSAITSGVPVSYYVCAVSAAGQGANSNTVSLDPGGASLAAPSGLTATNDSNANIYLTWNPTPGATSYNLYKGTQAGQEAALPIATSITTNSYTDGNVVPDAPYYYKVTALNSFGESAKSNEASVTNAKATLAAPILKGTTSGTSAVLTWSAVSGATGYDLYRSIAGAGYMLIASTTSVTVTDTGLTAGVPVSYYVTTVNAGGQSGGSNTVTLTIGATATLPAPTGVYAYSNYNSIIVSGNTVPGATSYNIYRGTSAGGEGATPIATGVTATSNGGQIFYNYDYNVTATTTYYYFVTAVNGVAESGHSNEASATYGVSQLPAPTLIGTGSTGQVALKWTATSGATSYNLYRSVGATGNFSEYKTGLTGTTYTDTGLTSGIVYEYLVAAANKDGQGTNSNTVSLYAGGSVLPAPFGLVVGVSGGSALYLQWNFVAGATSYNIYRGTSAGGEGATPIASGITSGTNNGFGNYTDTTANVQGQAYYYYVTAVNGTGESGKSNEAHAVTGSGVTAAPTLVGVGSSAQVVLTWSIVSGATSYTLYRNAGTGFVTYQIGLTGTTYTDASLTNGVTYQYYLAAITSNNQGYGSNTVTVTPTSTVLSAPAGLEAYPSGNGIIVAWNYVPGASFYNVYRSTSAGGEGSIPIATGVTQTYNGYTRYYINDTPLATGQTYYYKVTAVNAGGESAKSAEVSATQGGTGLPAPTLSAVPGSNTVALTWTPVSGATAYRLFRTDPNNSNYYTAIQSGSTATTYTDSTAKNGLTYSYVVEGYNAIGSGNGSNTVTVTVGAGSGNPLPAPGIIAQPINNGVTLTFTTVPGATSYIIYRGTSSGGETPFASGIAPSSNAATSYTDTTAANYTAYYYKVAAQNGYGVGTQSSEVSATPPTTGAADFLTTATPTAISIAAGTEDTVTVGLTFTSSLTTPVSLTVTGAPSGVTASFDPPSAGSGGSYLDIAVGTSASPGTYTLTVKGVDGSVTHTITVTLQVVAAGSNAATANLSQPWDGLSPIAARPVSEKRASLLNDIGRLGRPVTVAEIQAWKNDLHAGRVGALRAAQLHLWLGEYALAHNEQPEQALAQFRSVRRIAVALPASNRPDGPLGLRTLASYDSGFALFYMGAYAQARDAFRTLVVSKAAHPGLDRQTCALWWRHSLGCAGYHTERAALGIPEPPRLDPRCGIAALAACLRKLNQPYAVQRLLASCRVTGEGSHMSDLVAAAPKLGVTMKLVVADDRGLTLLPKPVVAYVEHDHFIAVTKADASGVSYLCSDCGAWPGGQVNLTWAQWHKMDATDYGVVTLPDSAWDRKIKAMEAYEADQANGRLLRVASTNLSHLLPSIELLTLAMHIHPNVVNPGGSQGCGQTPDGPKCPPGVCCPEGGPGPGPGPDPGPTGGDPANLATGEEEYTPAADLTVYNPYGPQVTWSRIYGSLRSSTESAYQYNDFGAGWSQTYNVGVYDPSPGSTGTKYVFFPNGSRLSFSAPAVPSSTTPAVQCAPQAGARMLVEWDYNNGAYNGSFKITFADRTKWVTTASIGYPYYCSLLSQLVDRNGNAIAFTYQQPVNGSFPLLQTISDPVHGTKLLSIKRANDGTGNIVSVNDAYGRSIYYHSSYYTNVAVPNGYPQGHQEVDHISEIVKTFSSSKPDRAMLGYVLATNREGSEKVRYLGSITVPSPTGTGTSTAYENYDPSDALLTSIVDGNGNTTEFSYVNANGQPDEAGSYTQVDTYNASNELEKSYTVAYDNNLSETALYTPAAPAMAAMQAAHGRYSFNQGIGYAQFTYTFADPNNPYKPSSVVDANGNTTSSTWDQYGNVLTSTSARGTKTTNTYVYTNFALGECTKTVIGTKSPTSYTYYEPSGLVKTIVDPLPGTVGSTSTATITYTYNQYGDIATLVDPGNNAVTTNTRTFGFGSTPKLGQPLTVTDNLGHVTTYTYDAQGNPLSIKDAVGNTTNYTYDIANNRTQITYPATVSGGGRAYQATTYLYPGGPNTVVTDYSDSGTAIRKVTYGYGLEGELLSVSGSAEPVTYTYNSLYQKASIADGSGHASHYYYNTAGFLAAVTAPGYTGSAYPNISGKDSVTYPSYDPLGNPLTRVDGNGKKTTYAYNDPENKRTDITYPSGTLAAVHLTYDAYGRRHTVTDGTGSATTTYDDRDNTLSVATTYTGVAAKTVSYTYYADGSRKTLVTPAGTYTSTYDGGGRLTGLTNPYGEASSWAYYNNNVLQTQTLGNASAATVAKTTYTYNSRLFLTDQLTKNGSGTTLSEYGSTATVADELQYDGVGNRTQVMASLYNGGTLLGSPYTGTTTYTYDAGQTANPALNRSQVTKEVTGSTTTSYAYDGGNNGGPGNLTSIRGKTYTYDDDNQLSGTGFAYDGNGNPTTYQSSTLTYDVENHLTAVGTAFTAAYTLDGLRAWKQNSAGTRTYYLYDGGLAICELSNTGSVTAAPTYGVNGLVSRHVGSTTTFYTWDPQRNLAQMLSSTGAVTNSFHFDSFGNKTSTSATTDPYSGIDGQDGAYTDSETGLTLLMLRYYDSGTGRFLTRDPTSYMGGINVYAYTQNNPVNRIDPIGLDAQKPSCTPPPPNHCQRDYNDCLHDAQVNADIAIAACTAAALTGVTACFFTGPGFPVCAGGVIAAEAICLGAAVAVEKYAESVCSRNLQHCLQDAGS